VKPEAIEAKIRAAIPDARVQLKDLTGTEDHWLAELVSAMFAGLSLVQS
jgi:stress-induced morphogen